MEMLAIEHSRPRSARRWFTTLATVALAATVSLSIDTDDLPQVGRLVPASVSLNRAAMPGESRFVLDEKSRRFEITIPQSASLEIGVAVSNAAWAAGLEVIEHTVEWISKEGTKTLLKRRAHKPPRPGLNAWMDLMVPLDAVRGLSGTIVLGSRPIKGAAPGTDQIMWTPPVLRGEPRAAGPNVILISMDTLRADRLGCYGYGRETSPAIDKMAREGVLFRQAIAPASWTLPSHASLFTGLHPSKHGAVVFGQETPLSRSLDTLPEILRRSGYDTAGFVGGVFVAAEMGFDQGFDRYRDPGYLAIFPVPFERNVELAIDWMSNRRDRRFFVFLHSYQVHMPYQPPPPYDTVFDPSYDGRYQTRFTHEDYAPYRYSDAIEPRDLEHIQALYDGEIRNMDDAIDKLLGFLRDSGLAENTCVIFTSDHGEEFKEHGNLFHHHAKLFEQQLRIPMIVWCPSMFEGGRTVEQQVALVDVLPTVLELAGVSIPTTDGSSFADALRGGALAPDRRTFAEVDGSTESGPSMKPKTGRTSTIRTERYKLIASDVEGHPDIALFDLLEDPAEERNLASELPALVARLSEELRRTLPATRVGGAGDSAPTPDEKTKERLRALGYLQ